MKQSYITLNDGRSMPAAGFGVFLIPGGGPARQAVLSALQAGYRHIDTAAAYFNEEDVGQAVRESGLRREEIFVTSKLWLQDHQSHGAEGARRGLERSLRKLGLDYIDLYLIHQPYGDVAGAWQALEQARSEGLLRSIGVSNMSPAIWQKFVPDFEVRPAVNQVEFNPLWQQRPLRALMEQTKTVLEAWYPLGHGSDRLLHHEVIAAAARCHGKTPAQIVLRFELQEGAVVLPKSLQAEHMQENLQIFDFELDAVEMAALRALDEGHGAHDPDAPGVAAALLQAFHIDD